MPVTLLRVLEAPFEAAAARPYLKLDDAEADLELNLLIAAMADRAGQETGRSIAKCEWELTLDAFPASEIRLLWPPIVSVDAVTYVDTDGLLQTLPDTHYVLDAQSSPGWLLPAAGHTWPDTADAANTVAVRYTAGYGAACPEAIRLWLLAHVGNHLRNRESTVTGTIVASLPFVDGLLDRYRTWSV